MEKERKVLEGWKAIADFLGVSEKTASRWHKTSNLPVYQKGKKKKVYAFEDELTEWLKQDNTRHSTSKPQKPALKFAFWAVIAVFLAIVFADSILFSRKKTTLKLIYDAKKVGNNIIINIRNQDGSKVKTISFKSTLPFLPKRENYPWITIGDFNGDFREDFAYFNPELVENSIFIYIADKNGNLSLYKEKKFDIEAVFENKNINMNHIHFIKAIDINGDGKDEIGVAISNNFLYPTCFLILDGNLEKQFVKIMHPGWIKGVLARDLNKDGKFEIYITGTNNILHKEKSEAVAIAIETNGNYPVFLDFHNPGNRKIPECLKSKGKIKAVYVRFGYNSFIRKYSVWQFAYPGHSDKEDGFLLIKCDNFSTTKLASFKGNYVKCDLRDFIFGYMLKHKGNGFWNSAFLTKLDIKIPEKAKQNLLIPLYFNGKKWTTNYSFYPICPVNE